MAKGVEIERKFLVKHLPGDIEDYPRYSIDQGYLSLDKARCVRVRFELHNPEGAMGFLNVKGKTVGIAHLEYEYEIPAEDALELLHLCAATVIQKVRYQYGRWEIDVFQGDNEGLLVAEIELSSEEEQFEIPEWLGVEISDDPRFANLALAQVPYKSWK
jgi:CYTH domain-containing protein